MKLYRYEPWGTLGFTEGWRPPHYQRKDHTGSCQAWHVQLIIAFTCTESQFEDTFTLTVPADLLQNGGPISSKPPPLPSRKLPTLSLTKRESGVTCNNSRSNWRPARVLQRCLHSHRGSEPCRVACSTHLRRDSRRLGRLWILTPSQDRHQRSASTAVRFHVPHACSKLRFTHLSAE